MSAAGWRTVSRETLLAPVHAWRLVSRLLPPRCRYHPSCSQYCLDAVRRHGPAGFLLGIWRVLRCNPWSLGGVDHVPERLALRPWPARRSDAPRQGPGGADAPQPPVRAGLPGASRISAP